jgi:alanyl-tRNA synthetase
MTAKASSPIAPNDLRRAWQAFFAAKGHANHPSAPLVPANDPTLLFTGAGMNQFKDMFLGKGTHPFTRASTVQKCLRAGDIDNVGKTLRHFTFFEMLGNFSFDDYFKEEAIAWAWEFTLGTLRLPADRVTVTIYRDDDESFALWRKAGVPAERIHRFGARALGELLARERARGRAERAVRAVHRDVLRFRRRRRNR